MRLSLFPMGHEDPSKALLPLLEVLLIKLTGLNYNSGSVWTMAISLLKVCCKAIWTRSMNKLWAGRLCWENTNTAQLELGLCVLVLYLDSIWTSQRKTMFLNLLCYTELLNEYFSKLMHHNSLLLSPHVLDTSYTENWLIIISWYWNTLTLIFRKTNCSLNLPQKQFHGNCFWKWLP